MYGSPLAPDILLLQYSPSAHLQHGDIGIRSVLQRNSVVCGCALSCYGQHGLWCPVKVLWAMDTVSLLHCGITRSRMFERQRRSEGGVREDSHRFPCCTRLLPRPDDIAWRHRRRIQMTVFWEQPITDRQSIVAASSSAVMGTRCGLGLAGRDALGNHLWAPEDRRVHSQVCKFAYKPGRTLVHVAQCEQSYNCTILMIVVQPAYAQNFLTSPVHIDRPSPGP